MVTLGTVSKASTVRRYEGDDGKEKQTLISALHAVYETF